MNPGGRCPEHAPVSRATPAASAVVGLPVGVLTNPRPRLRYSAVHIILDLWFVRLKDHKFIVHKFVPDLHNNTVTDVNLNDR